MKEKLYSIRMHASLNNRHISGAERIADDESLDAIAVVLMRRALGHSKGKADSIHLTVDELSPSDINTGRLPDLSTLVVKDYLQGRNAAVDLLLEAGVSEKAARAAIEAMANGAAPDGQSMRGAMLVDASSGERLEQDRARGVRASRMDLTSEAEKELRRGLQRLGLNNQHVREALVLAAKVISAPGIVAELCWSDDPDYVAGYVATVEKGYVRLPHLKPAGDERGGRAFFVHRDRIDIKEVVDYLEHSVLLVDKVGALNGEAMWEE